jgi:pyruvate formate lyase activating enzyme
MSSCPGITDVRRLLERTREFISHLDNVQRIEVLPYHTLGIFKWDELGTPYTLEGVATQRGRVRNAERILRKGSSTRRSYSSHTKRGNRKIGGS